MARIGKDAYAFGGEQGLVAFLHGGALWDVRRYPDPDVVFHGIASDGAGKGVFAVGERASRGQGIAVELSGSGFRRTFELADLGALRSVAYMDPTTIFACGDGGGLVRIEEQGLTRIAWERTGHLRAMAASRTPVARALAVGTGGHALSVAADGSGRTSIEKVMTTQDLLGVNIGDEGAAWATSANARVLRRDPAGCWRRVSGDLPTTSNLLRVWGSTQRVLIVAEDATILEGMLS